MNQDLSNLQQQSQQAYQQAMDLTKQLPQTLRDLTNNLNKTFSTNNPLMQQRTGMMEDYLASADKARAEYLASGKAYSPTQLQAMTSARQAAALAPLAGINQQIVGQAGGIQDYLGFAQASLNAQIQAQQMAAQAAQQAYNNELQRQQWEVQKQQSMLPGIRKKAISF